VFIRLYGKTAWSIVGKRLVNWDPKLHTPRISDLEVENKEEKGFFLAPARLSVLTVPPTPRR